MIAALDDVRQKLGGPGAAIGRERGGSRCRTRRIRRSLLAVFFITLFSLAADATTVVPLS
jgi:hypothetical protein